MRRRATGIRQLKLSIWFFGLVFIVGCENWDLATLHDPLMDGLIAYYPFNGNTLDVSGNMLNGQLINGATYGTDRNNASQSALLLDGIDDYFEIPDNSKLRPDSISISLWIKARQVASSSHIYNKSNFSDNANQQYSAFIRPPKPPNSGTACCELVIDVNNNGSCILEQPVQNPVIYYDPTYVLNKWYHIVSVYAGQTHKLYINGELKMTQKEQTQNPIDKCVGGNLRFGAQSAYVTDYNYFDGMMDEIRIYNRGLTQTEIITLYNR